MSVATELTLLANSKQAIKNSINQKGGSVTDSTPFADYSTAIDNLPSGGETGNPLLKSIDVDDFSGTTFNEARNYITSAVVPNGVTRIGSYAFIYFGITSISLPNTLTTLDTGAFSSCTYLTTLTIPSSVTTIGHNCFENCSSITSLTIPNAITQIQYETFKGCSSLSSFTIPSGVTSIGYGAFRDCRLLTSITIPSNVVSIDYDAFKDCRGLNYVISFPTTPPTLGTNVFNNTNNCPIYVQSSSLESYKTAWSQYADRIQAIPEDVKPAFKFTSSVDSSKDITVNCEDTETAGTLKANDLGMSSQQIDEFRSAENTGSVEIGDCVKIYMAAACYTAKGISEVKLNEGLERIGDFAFGGMSALTEITIPSTVTNISYQAFYADRALQGITCLATTPPTLGSEVFGDTNNCTIYVPYDSVDAYKSAWSQYADRIQAIPAE